MTEGDVVTPIRDAAEGMSATGRKHLSTDVKAVDVEGDLTLLGGVNSQMDGLGGGHGEGDLGHLIGAHGNITHHTTDPISTIGEVHAGVTTHRYIGDKVAAIGLLLNILGGDLLCCPYGGHQAIWGKE